jgi:hypothetical protein
VLLASAVQNTGTNGQLSLYGTEVAFDMAGNWSDVSWALYLDERVAGSTAWVAGGVSADIGWIVNGGQGSTLWAGTFGFDFRPGGGQSQLIASGTSRFYHAPNGVGSVYLEGNMGATGTGGAGGPTQVSLNVPITVTKVVPGTPTGVTASYISDTQVQLNWTQSSASNGQPEANEIQYSLDNGTTWEGLLAIQPANSTVISGWAANRRATWRVRAWNQAAGYSAWSVKSNNSFTTPAAPTAASAVKNSNLDIVVAFTSNVGYPEHTHEVWHGVVSGGVTTWDGTALATLASGVTSYTHAAPNAAQVHTYRVRAKAGSLVSGYANTGSVQLLAAPNKPTIPAMPAAADKASALVVNWVHNAVDTTPQKFYEFSYSTNGGTSWTTTGKVTSAVSQRTIAASTYAANVALTMRVRTWGSATTGGSDSTGASPWSDLTTVTFKTIPVATIISPAASAVLSDSTLRVTLGFAQAESASFVKAQLELLQSGNLVETLESSILVGITMATKLVNGGSYSVRARVQDSNGLWSAWKTTAFTVTYLSPVPAVATTSFLPDTGFGQLDLTIAAPGGSQSAAVTVSITRTINGVEEVVVADYPVSASMTFLDTTPTINGTNTYKITTTAANGAQSTITVSLVTTECRRAYLSKGAGYAVVGVFGGNLSVNESLSVASDTVEAAGRLKPIGLYGVETSVQLKVQSYVFENFGSTVAQLRDLLLMPGKACYRDSSGRRVFGAAKGSVAYRKVNRADLSFTLTETS